MARTGITFEQVAAVAEILAGDGQSPTLRAAFGNSLAIPAVRTPFTSIWPRGAEPVQWPVTLALPQCSMKQ